jgi:hypothetical protein
VKFDMSDLTPTSLWLAILISGIYHGINPGMGWPLAVSAGLMGKSRKDIGAALGLLAGGHFMAMAGILLPFAAMATLVAWQQEIRLAAGMIVTGAGIYLLINRRHPRFLARIRPTQLALWSFAVATVHGAGLMLVPIYLGLCTAEELDSGQGASSTLIGGSLITAVNVATAHTVAMLVSGGMMAFAVHEWLGLKFIARNWFNLETIWPLSLILVGGIGMMSVVIG